MPLLMFACFFPVPPRRAPLLTAGVGRRREVGFFAGDAEHVNLLADAMQLSKHPLPLERINPVPEVRDGHVLVLCRLLSLDGTNSRELCSYFELKQAGTATNPLIVKVYGGQTVLDLGCFCLENGVKPPAAASHSRLRVLFPRPDSRGALPWLIGKGHSPCIKRWFEMGIAVRSASV